MRLTLSGVSPGDTKKRRGWLGSSMPCPRVVPHSDGAGVVDAAVLRNGAVVAAYATRADRPSFDFWPMLFDNVTIRLLDVTAAAGPRA